MELTETAYNNKGLLDEYRRPKMAWHTLKEIIRNNKKNY